MKSNNIAEFEEMHLCSRLVKITKLKFNKIFYNTCECVVFMNQSGLVLCMPLHLLVIVSLQVEFLNSLCDFNTILSII